MPPDVLSDPIRNSLAAEVANALQCEDREQDNAAVNPLNAFKNEVSAPRGKKIHEEAAKRLLAHADNVIARIKSESQ